MGVERNWFDQLRLLFAAMVILTHSFDLLPGRNADYEPLRLLTNGTTSFSAIGVCGFFVLSGFLIARSWQSNPDHATYLRNRILRIAPAFVVAFWLSVLVAGGIGAGDALAYYRSLNWPLLAGEVLMFHQPTASFPGTFAEVNGAMWTIKYEFLCYLLTPLIVLRRSVLAGLWFLTAAGAVFIPHPAAMWFLMFASGAAYQVYGLRPRRSLLFLAAVALPILLQFHLTSELGLGTAGAYLLLGLAQCRCPLPKFPDVSYGTYLYGWPAQKVLMLWGLTNPWVLFAVALPVSVALGAASWFGIERRALMLKRRAAAYAPAPVYGTHS